MTKSLYRKYEIKKTNGNPCDPEADYFVLRIDTDRHARVALKAYAESIKVEEPEFSQQLLDSLADYEVIF